MADDSDDREELEERLDRLEATLEELRHAVVEDERVDAERMPAAPGAETALRLTERLVVPATVAALEANVRALEFVQDRLHELERRDTTAGARPARGEVSERMLDRFDDALARLEDAIVTADLPRDAEARQLLERARDLNAEARGRAGSPGRGPTGADVVRIDVEEELDDIRDEVDAEGDGPTDAGERDQAEE